MTSTDATAGSRTTLTAGDLFGRTFSLWGARFVPSTSIALLFHAPLLLTGWAMLGRHAPSEAGIQAWELVNSILSSILGALASAAITYGALRHLRGQDTSVGACAKRAFECFGSLFVASVLVVLIGIVATLPVAAIAVAVMVGARGAVGADTAGIVGAALAALVFAVLIARYFVYVAAIVVERVGGAQSLKESARLSAGFRGALFLFGLLISAAPMMLAIGIGYVVPDPFLRALVVLGFTIFVSSPLSACSIAVAYHRLKLRKDGIDVLDAAKVFD